MRTITLKAGFQFYDVHFDKITKYEYLCELPFNSNEMKGKYHILINRVLQEPVKVYYQQLDKMIDNSVSTYEEAQKLVVQNLQERIQRLNEKIDGKD